MKKNITFCLNLLLLFFSSISSIIFILGVVSLVYEEFLGFTGYEQVLFHFFMLFGSDIKITCLLIISFLIVLLALIIMLFVIKKPQVWSKKHYPRIHELCVSHRYLTSFITSAFCLLSGLFFLDGYNLSLFTDIYYHSLKGNTYETHFIDANNVDFKTKNTKNVIVILAESMEQSFSDKTIFKENLLFPLTESKGKSVLGYQNVNGTEWTFASELSLLCGIPFKYSEYYWKDVKNGKVFPKTLCLPQILKKFNYNTYYLQGSSSDFVYTDLLLKQHSLDNYEDISNAGTSGNMYTDKLIGYILPDSEIFSKFKIKIRQLSEQDRPFFAIMVTMNTHFPKGYTEITCSKKYNDMRDAVKCSSQQLSDFVKWVQEQNFNYDTSLVILGDHLMMPSNIQNMINKVPHRKTINYIWSKNVKSNIRKDFSQFDWMPTLLELSGITWNSHRLGLGTSLLSDDKTLAQIYKEDLNKKLLYKSDLYNTFFESYDKK